MGGTFCRCRSSDQVAKATLWLPWYMVRNVLRAIEMAEDRLGQPPTVCQVYIIFDEHFHHDQIQVGGCMTLIYNLFREDLVFTDQGCYKFTTRPREGFYNYSHYFRQRYGSTGAYKTISDGRIWPAKARTVNLNDLLAMLKSKDKSLFETNRWLWEENDFKFLDGQPIEPNRIAFNSFPRSGNSFLRRFIEQTSGLSTGSTWGIHTGTILQVAGFAGEAYTDDHVWVIKTMHPMILPSSGGAGSLESFKANKCFFCVRNPLDVIPSCAARFLTLTHTNKTDYDLQVEYPEWWDWFVRKQTRLMRRYYDIVRKHCDRVPTYFVRYEDLVLNPKETLLGLFCFLLDAENVIGSNCERRLDEVLQMGATATTTY